MRWVVGFACVVAVCRVASADSEIHGHVVDDETGLPIAGASILVGDQAAVTDDAGDFTVTGEGTLTITAAGYASVTVGAKPGVTVRLAKKTGEVIEISGKAPEESKPIAYTMTAQDIASTPGAMNDALRAITILPAAARIPFSFGGVVLRGMSPRDSSIFVDGVEIPLAFHFGGITGVFPTQALQDMRVVPSGFDVSMGRTQGGIVELTTRRPRADAYRVGGEVSLLHSLVSAEGPIFKHGAMLLTLRRSYLDVLIRPLLSVNDPTPSYSDGVLRAVWGEPAKKGELAAYVIGSLDRIANSEDAADPYNEDADGHIAVNLGFVRAGATYKRKIDKSLYTLAPYIGTNILTLYSKDYTHEEPPTPPMLEETDISRRWYLFGSRGEWLRDDPHGFIRAGVDLEGGYLGRIEQPKEMRGDGDLALPRNTVLWANAAIFAETRRQWYGDKLSVRPGLRLDRFGLGEQWAIDPRINAHATLTSTATLRASLGRFHQPPSPAHFDEFADNLNAKSSYVDQATLTAEVSPEDGVVASVTGFFHEGRKTLVDIEAKNVRPGGIDLDLIFKELLEDQLGLYAYQDNVGRQRSYGIETSLKYDKPRYRFLANFTWSRSKRRYDPALMLGWVPYGLDQPLRVNLLAATTAHKWNFGVRFSSSSGNPLHWVPAGTNIHDFPDSQPQPLLQRLPTFWQLDFRIDHSWKQSWGSVTGFLDMQNVTNHRNVEYRDTYPNDQGIYVYEDTRGLPIIPYIGVEFVPR
ncbi:MAG TPA: TonB-dependent receptor [Kofleriaceae bacterium]|nr:TonB-dependent receptor [Kofleriaceae bacterium]